MTPIFDKIPQQNKGCDIFKILLLLSAVKTSSLIICENHKGIISCPNGKLIDVVNATYGRLDRQTCHDDRIKSTDCRSSNSLKHVQNKCKGKSTCELHANYSEFRDDPCPGTYKYLEVKYRCLEFINLGKRENDKMCLNYASHFSYSRQCFMILAHRPMLLRHTFQEILLRVKALGN